MIYYPIIKTDQTISKNYLDGLTESKAEIMRMYASKRRMINNIVTEKNAL